MFLVPKNPMSLQKFVTSKDSVHLWKVLALKISGAAKDLGTIEVQPAKNVISEYFFLSTKSVRVNHFGPRRFLVKDYIGPNYFQD